MIGALVVSLCLAPQSGCSNSQSHKDDPAGKPSSDDPSKQEPKGSPDDSVEPETEPETEPEPEPGDSEDPGESDSADDGPEPKFDLGADPEPEKVDEACPIDFLFVIDNSQSMANEQSNLANSVPKFIETIKTKIEDLEEFHIGITSTDAYSANADIPECRKKMGGFVTQVELATDPLDQNGPPPKKCGPYASGKRFMNQADDLSKTFTCAAKLGTVGHGMERSMDAMRAAISKEMLAPGACNEGFLRDDALLVVVVITDEEDSIKAHLPGIQSGSQGDPPDWYKALIDAKGGDERRVVVLGLLGTPAPNDCEVLSDPDEIFVKDDGAQISPRLIEFVKSFKQRGVVGDVCAPDYGPFFQAAVDTIDVACEELPPQ